MIKIVSPARTRAHLYQGEAYAGKVTVDFIADGVRGKQVLNHGTNLVGEALIEHCMESLQYEGKGIDHIEVISMRWEMNQRVSTTVDTEWNEIYSAEG